MKVLQEHVEDFYDEYRTWCILRGFPVLHKENIGRFLVCYSYINHAIYSVMVWDTPSKMVLIGWPIGNPENTEQEKKEGLNYLFQETVKILSKEKYQAIWTISSVPPVTRALKLSGFEETDKNASVYINSL